MKYQGATLEQAVSRALRADLAEGDGGMISVDRQGNVFMDFTTKGMARATADSSGRFDVLWSDE